MLFTFTNGSALPFLIRYFTYSIDVIAATSKAFVFNPETESLVTLFGSAPNFKSMAIYLISALYSEVKNLDA